ncbi:MAG TPA: hypothetical protein VEB68_03445 [Croceibacterium sp.]|nr:hypothetical protein [Croceibacterium sp.]
MYRVNNVPAASKARPFDAQPIGAIAAAVAGYELDRKTRLKLGRGDSKRTGQPVWRNSYYEGIEKKVWRPFGDGTTRGGKRLAGALLAAARRVERTTRAERKAGTPGLKRGVLGDVGVAVLETLLELVDFATGRLEPAIETIAERAGYCYSAAHAALCRLREHGFLHWVRRSRPIEEPRPGGQQVEQITNAYILLVPEQLRGLVELICGKAPLPADEEWRRAESKRQVEVMLAGLDAQEFMRATWTGDPLAGETLRRIASLLEPAWKGGANTQMREKPGDHTDP